MSNEKVECESCHLPIDKDKAKSFKRFDYLCPLCHKRESSIIPEKPAEPTKSDTEKVHTVWKEIKSADVTKREEYFNAEAQDIALISGTVYERAIKLKDRIEKYKNLLFEMAVRENANLVHLHQLSSQLRKEERESLKIQNIEYSPLEPKVTKAKGPRLSKEDKSLQVMAQAVFGKKLALLDEVNKKSFVEHPDWWNNGEVKSVHHTAYIEYVEKHGAMTIEQAIARMKEVVRNSRAKQFTELAEGTRALSDPLIADSDRKKSS